jgi:C-terminal processing protease CtpA/Prc
MYRYFRRRLPGKGRVKPLLMLLACLCSCNLLAQESYTSAQFLADFDYLWSGLRDHYVYFKKKQTDWNRVGEFYRSRVRQVSSRDDFIRLLETVVDELYDPHLSLNTNLNSSFRLVPSGLDLWAEWIQGHAIITQLRAGFSAEQSGLKAGMEIVSINGVPAEDAVRLHLPRSLRMIDNDARNWALLAVLAGTHQQQRTIEARDRRGITAMYRLDLPAQTTVDRYEYIPKVEWKLLQQRIGYIKVNDLISSEIVAEFDDALERVRTSHGLILDLRDIPRGGNTAVAEPIIGRFINRTTGYQQVVPLNSPAYIKTVAPRGAWAYQAPLVVLVNRWTGSMGEGMAIGLDGMKRATVVGTRMAGLNGGIFNMLLPNTGIGVNYAGERLNHINGSPRESFVPPVLVDLMDPRLDGVQDPILAAGYRRLLMLIGR